jgi:hypothetical protein
MQVDDYAFTEEEKEILKTITCPIPPNENKRLAVLRQARLLDSSTEDSCYDNCTNLTALIFDVRL